MFTVHLINSSKCITFKTIQGAYSIDNGPTARLTEQGGAVPSTEMTFVDWGKVESHTGCLLPAQMANVSPAGRRRGRCRGPLRVRLLPWGAEQTALVSRFLQEQVGCSRAEARRNEHQLLTQERHQVLPRRRRRRRQELTCVTQVTERLDMTGVAPAGGTYAKCLEHVHVAYDVPLHEKAGLSSFT